MNDSVREYLKPHWTPEDREAAAHASMSEDGPEWALAAIFINASAFAESQTEAHPAHIEQLVMIADCALKELKRMSGDEKFIALTEQLRLCHTDQALTELRANEAEEQLAAAREALETIEMYAANRDYGQGEGLNRVQTRDVMLDSIADKARAALDGAEEGE